MDSTWKGRNKIWENDEDEGREGGPKRRSRGGVVGLEGVAVISLGRKFEQFCDSDRCQAHANSDRREGGRKGGEEERRERRVVASTSEKVQDMIRLH